MTDHKKTFLITGSSSGIGRAAKLFAARGWNVIATMRSPEKEMELNKIDGFTVHALENGRRQSGLISPVVQESTVLYVPTKGSSLLKDKCCDPVGAQRASKESDNARLG